jgi:phosphoribosylanthranilate isomerase
MEPVSAPRVKICCIQSTEEARLAIEAGASALGLVAEMPSGPGVISDKTIHEIAAAIPPPIATFLLTSRTDASAIIEHQRAVRTNTLQIVDRLQSGTHEDIRRALPGIRIVQVIHVVDESALLEAVETAPHVDALLLDSGNPRLPVKELGGTGRRHNWAISRRIREQVDKPVFLAGGLTADNVRDAVREVAPFAVDVCSGVRIDGRLDPHELERFFQALTDSRR